MSQRELAQATGFSRSTIGKLETGSLKPSISTLLRVLSATDLVLVVTDADGKVVQPLKVWDGVCDGAGRNYPAHLDVVIDPNGDEWWGGTYGLARPPETFEHRPREYRDAKRKLSQWEVRVKQFRHDPRPPDPDRPPAWRRRKRSGPADNA